MQLKPVTPTAQAPAANFTGTVYVNPLHAQDEPSQLNASMVRFTPGARTHWHSHANGQLLYCTDGSGLVVNRAGTVLRIRPGDTVWTPPGEEHWHGGGAENMMCHLALFEGVSGGNGTTWIEPVTDDQYQAAQNT